MNYIKNKDLPICKNCRFFIPHKIPEHQTTLSRCSKFGEKDIVSGEINYDFADFCRNNSMKCGKSGIHFEAIEAGRQIP
jgi:hypothetical protein